ncbi:hypothetical protein CEP51_014988 [Fusarium floridanum]|uniref:Uncharacterized protein n=1 Tax=Fusarium floridanum TaxID=1325733 RepID=A0A428PIF0_9HYPO|nr:hypothetical protein CEP51_014988 [Fusarium floridanum]
MGDAMDIDPILDDLAAQFDQKCQINNVTDRHHIRGISVMDLIEDNAIRIPWLARDRILMASHCAKYKLNVGNCETLALDDLIERLGMLKYAKADFSYQTVLTKKLKSALNHCLKRLASHGHVDLTTRKPYRAIWKPYTAAWGEDGWDGDEGSPHDNDSGYFSQPNGINSAIGSPRDIGHHRTESCPIEQAGDQAGQQGHGRPPQLQSQPLNTWIQAINHTSGPGNATSEYHTPGVTGHASLSSWNLQPVPEIHPDDSVSTNTSVLPSLPLPSIRPHFLPPPTRRRESEAGPSILAPTKNGHRSNRLSIEAESQSISNLLIAKKRQQDLKAHNRSVSAPRIQLFNPHHQRSASDPSPSMRPTARSVPQPPAASHLATIPEATPALRPSTSEADEERALYEQITTLAYLIRINVSDEVECPEYRAGLIERLAKAAELPAARTFVLLIESVLSMNS